MTNFKISKHFTFFRLTEKVTSVLRWRYVRGEDGVAKRQSNARLIKWADGKKIYFLKLIFDLNCFVSLFFEI